MVENMMTGADLGARYDHAQRTITRLNEVIAALQRLDRDIAQALCSHQTYDKLKQFTRDACLSHLAHYDPTRLPPTIPEVIPVPLKIDDSIPFGIIALERGNWSGLVRFADINLFNLA